MSIQPERIFDDEDKKALEGIVKKYVKYPVTVKVSVTNVGGHTVAIYVHPEDIEIITDHFCDTIKAVVVLMTGAENPKVLLGNVKSGVEPEFSEQAKHIFLKLLKALVKHPEDVNFARIKGSLDMEIKIKVHPDDEKIIDADLCEFLAAVISALTETHQPVVYLEDKPHPNAVEALDYATKP